MSGVDRSVPGTEPHTRLPALRRRRQFLGLVIFSQAMTIGITWPLWQVRESPPNLPWVDLPQIPYGILLLITLGAVWLRPVAGWWAHISVLALAILSDQLRLQPQMISMPLLMLLSFAAPSARAIGFAHLAAVWFFSGFHKVVSPKFFTQMSGWMLHAIAPGAPDELAQIYGAVITLVEMTIGVLVFVPALRRPVAVVALIVHLGILATLSPLGSSSNPSVWSWNVVLAAVGPLLLWQWSEGPGSLFGRAKLWAKVVCLGLILMPIGYYAGWHAHLSICLYTKNKPIAWIQRAGQPPKKVDFWDAMEVPIPPAHGTFVAYFEATAEAGDLLEIRDQRGWARSCGLDRYLLSYELVHQLPQKLLEDLPGGRMTPHPGKMEDILYRIDLSGTGVDDQDLTRLATLQGLAVLDVSGTKVTDRGLRALLTLPHLEKVRAVNTSLTPAGARAFAEARPDVAVELE